MSAAPGKPLRPDARQQALAWLVTMWSGEATAEERHALAYWRSADAEHERAWQQVQGLGQAIRDIPPGMDTALRSSPGRNKRRAVLRSLLGLSVAGLAGYGATRTARWSEWTADIHTARHERRELVLPDGTQVHLNGGTAIDLAFDAGARRILLRSGEIILKTAHEAGPYRPLSVVTPLGNVQALGTYFSVRLLEDTARVAVFDGAVRVTPATGRAAPLELEAGQGVEFSASAAGTPFVVDTIETAWTKGLLVADRMRMADFLAELGRYRSGVLRCEPEAAGLIVSGVYPLRDTDAVLDSLAQALPVRVQRLTRYWVTVSKK